MRKCPACKRVLDDHLRFCPFDGQALPSGSGGGYAGMLLDDKYRLEEKIGEGGTGEVYRARHVLMEAIVAVKILHPSLASDQITLERFRREAQAAAQIRHPNAVAVTDFGVTRDTRIAYLVMEFLEGEDLRERINRRKQLDFEETLLILDQTCSAVHAAHSKGIIHRDLKPDNIWILRSENDVAPVKVLDFGIAKLKSYAGAANLTEKGLIIGTPNYMSPEQCRGEELDPRSDIYSMGVILYEMLTGDAPFQADTPVAVVLKHASEPPRPLRELRPEIPATVERVVLKALQKRRDDRQGSALQLANDFEKALHASGIETGAPRAKTPKPVSVDTSPMARNTQVHKDTEVAALKARPTVMNAPPVELSKESYKTRKSPTPIDIHSSRKTQASELAGFSTGEQPTLVILDETRIATPARSRKGLVSASALVVIVIGIVLAVWLWPSGAGNLNPGAGGGPVAAGAPPGMIFVQGGMFVMGNNASDEESEKPEHEMSVVPFYIDRYEVTNEEYYEFIRVTRHASPSNWISGKFPAGEDKYPVAYVSWFDAQEYAKWIGKRLPTETEWECAARSDDRRLYPWGNDFTPQNANSTETEKNHPMPVGSYPAGASRFGILDMAGNVAEWTDSDYSLYEGSKARMEPGNKIIRGGSFRFDKRQAMVTTRWSVPPGTLKDYIGFRLARDAQR